MCIENIVLMNEEKFNIGAINKVSPLGRGIINQTFLVQTEKDNYVLQKLHPFFDARMLEDIEEVFSCLAEHNIKTQQLVFAKNGNLYVEQAEEKWRMLTFIPGKIYECGISQKQAESAGELVGRYHNALCNLKKEFCFGFKDFHRTDLIMKKLADIDSARKSGRADIDATRNKILSEYRKIKTDFSALPRRIIHGDLKINNVLFDERGENAIALIDPDTLGNHPVIIDLGDATRSWCNLAREDSNGGVRFDIGIFKSMMRGYFRTAHFMTREEKLAMLDGVALITLELLARFVIDAIEEKYFTLNKNKYKNLREQNIKMAAVQMKFFDDFQLKRNEAEKIISEYY